MKTISMGLLVGFALVSGCAGSGAVTQRGTVMARGESVRAFAAGPAEVHAFSMERGGKLFTATAVSGTDADCAQAANSAEAPIASDTVKVVKLASGEVACVSTPGQRSYELLWHARAPRSDNEETATMAHNNR
jgi:hypothetical protein